MGFEQTMNNVNCNAGHWCLKRETSLTIHIPAIEKQQCRSMTQSRNTFWNLSTRFHFHVQVNGGWTLRTCVYYQYSNIDDVVNKCQWWIVRSSRLKWIFQRYFETCSMVKLEMGSHRMTSNSFTLLRMNINLNDKYEIECAESNWIF